MKIAISSESTIDLQKDMIRALDIKVVSFAVTLGERTALDGDVTPKDIFAFVDKTGKLPRTSAVNDFQFEQHFEKIFSDGYDAIIHLSLSSSISAAYSNACRAAQKFQNVYVINTQSLSTGIALLAFYAYRLIKRGKTAEEIYHLCSERVPYVQASFVLNNLEYLYKGGRCSSLQRFGVNLLHIRPQILVVNGGMVSGRKYRGRDEVVVRKYCEDTLELYNTPDKTLAFVTATDYSPDIIQLAHECLAAKGFETIIHTTAGATITSHCGDKCIGILYLNDGDKNREF